MANEEKKDKVVTIFVDGTYQPWENKEDITFAEVVTFAYPDFGQNPKITYSVTYDKGPENNREGILPVGGEVAVKNEMEFRVSRTGES